MANKHKNKFSGSVVREMQTNHRRCYLESTRMVKIKKIDNVDEEIQQQELSCNATKSRNQNNHLGNLSVFIN